MVFNCAKYLFPAIVWATILIVLVGCGDGNGDNNAISGTVWGSDTKVEGAIVRIQTTSVWSKTDENGNFLISVANLEERSYALTAWAEGYFISGPVIAEPGTRDVKLDLKAFSKTDNKDYEWVSAFSDAGIEGNCENCHSDPDNETSLFPFDEWKHDAHSNSAKNIRFLTMYNGTDVNGNKSPLTRYATHVEYGRFPLPPNYDEEYYGPGFKLDFPATTGNCATCHAPAVAIHHPNEVDPTYVSGVGAEGVTCDFCHKIWDVKLDTSTGLPFPNMTGVLSYEYRRPEEGHQFFAGPLDDVAPGEDTYLPLQSESAFCAPCHFAKFWDTVVYNSYGEWLDSPYSDPDTGSTCQDCHMPRRGAKQFVTEENGGLLRNPETLSSHLMPGANDTNLLQDALTMTVETTLQEDKVSVEVLLVNDRTGHHVPTDSPLRHLILVVSCEQEDGQPLEYLSGPILPAWTGNNDRSDRDYGGQPGKVYAKILEESWTQVSPTGAYWNPTRVVSDNRLPAFGSDRSVYQFFYPQASSVKVHVKLVYRRAFIQLMKQKGWDAPDIVMAEFKGMF